MRVRRRFSTLSILALFATLVLSGSSAQASTPWHRVANLLHFRWDFQAATGSDGKIYAIGGCFTGFCGSPELTNTIDVYDPASDTWTRLPTHLPGGRAELAAAGDDGGHIYVLGGIVNPGGSNRPLMYTIATGEWTNLPRMPFPDSFYMGAAVGPDGRVYAVGGWGSTDTVQVYDPATNSWSLGPPLPRRVQEPAVVTVGSSLYVVGGYDSQSTRTNGLLRSIFAFDPSTGIWKRMRPMPRGRGFGQAAVGADGRIYVVGGFTADPNCGNCLDPLRKVIAFDPSTNSWSAARALPRETTDHGVARDAAGNIYSIGGEFAHKQVFELPIAP